MSDDKTTEAAQEQADEYRSFVRSAKVVAGNGQEFTVRNPMFFTASQSAAYNKLHHRMNKCDRWPDTEKPDQSMKSVQPDGTVVETHIGAHVVRGDFIEPYQEDGELVEPPYEVQAARIAMGDSEYEKYEAADGAPYQVVKLIRELRDGVQRRVDDDSKSDGGRGVLAAVPAPDSQ